MVELFVTNYNANFTGVSATAANVVRQQQDRYDMRLVGHSLPGCPAPIIAKAAADLSKAAPNGRPFAIWHVRRNPEMRHAIWLRDVRRLPIRIVFTSAAQRLHSAYPRWLISRMDAVIATTDRAAKFVPHVRTIVPHGVDTEAFHPATDRAAAWQAQGYGGTRGIATIGRIRPEKGTDQFVDAMLRLLPDHPDTTALVVGRAGRKHRAYLADLKAKVFAAGLAERLLFPGEIAASELPALMRSLSLVVQLPHYEGFGMVPLEGLASGVPFVGTDAGYYSAFSAQQSVGRIVPFGDPAQAAQAAETLLSQPSALADAARASVMGQFSARAEADGINAVYQDLWQS